MPAEQGQATDTAEIHCSGSMTQQHWREVRKLTGQNLHDAFYYMLLTFLFFWAGLSAYLAYDFDVPFLVESAGMSFFFSCMVVLWVFGKSYIARKQRKRAAAEKRGWFSEGKCTIDERGLSYESDTELSQYSGFIPWSSFARSKSTKSLIILYYDAPYDDSLVLVRDWFSSDADWQQFLDLAEQAIGSKKTQSRNT